MTNDELKEWRDKKSITQADAALAFKVSLDTWRKWEQGKSRIPEMMDLAIKGYEKK